MSKTIKVLLVDDHPIIIDAYTNSLKIFEDKNPEFKLQINTSNSCKSTLDFMKENFYDIIFLDVRLPATEDKKFRSGQDIACYVKKHYCKTKIIMITGHYDAFVLTDILQNINPISLLFKGDVDQKIISNVLKSVLENNPYYSLTILKLLRKNISSKIILDKTDKQLLLEISKGKRTKELSKILPLSIGGVEKRKRQLKDLFGASRLDDEDLISSAIEKGFL